ERDGGRDRMARIGEAVREVAVLVRLIEHRVMDAVVDDHGRDRQHRGGKRLRGRHHVGTDAEGLRAPHFAGPGKAGDDPGGAERMAELGGTGWICGKWVCGGRMPPPAPITGSAKKAATVSGPSARISLSSASAIRAENCSSLSPGSWRR